VKFQVLVENGTNDLYTATVVGLPDCRAQATTAQEAIDQVRQILLDRLSKAQVVWIDVPATPQEHPWMKFAGMHADNPLFDAVVENIAAYRRELDEDPHVI
jgi:hypothetical protein